jgi:hypothetical protein
VSFGTQDSEEGYVSQCPLLIPQRFLVLHSRDHMETDSKILGRSASPSSGAHEDLGIAFPFSHHSHSEKERDQRHCSGWADH